MVSIFGVDERTERADCFVKMKQWEEGVCVLVVVFLLLLIIFFMCFFNGKNIDLLVFL